MRQILTLNFLIGLFLLIGPATSLADCESSDCPGQPCGQLGLSKISDDRANIIFCGKNLLASAPELVWKSTVADVRCPAGKVVISVVNGVAKCMTTSYLVNIRDCDPEAGQFLIGIKDGYAICEGPITYSWGPWSECSAKCGGGTQTRNCIDSYGGGLAWQAFRCGGGEFTRTCNTHACPAPVLSTATGAECTSGSGAGCPGQPCQEDQFGTTQMSDDQANIIACLRNSVAASPAYVWKSTIADFVCPARKMVRSIKNGIPTCVDAVTQMLPGTTNCNNGMLVGFINGSGKCLYW